MEWHGTDKEFERLKGIAIELGYTILDDKTNECVWVIDPSGEPLRDTSFGYGQDDSGDKAEAIRFAWEQAFGNHAPFIDMDDD